MYEDQLTNHQLNGLRKVQVTREFHRVTGRLACAGATGWVIGQYQGVSTVLFDQASADLVDPEAVGQCSLRVANHCLRTV